MFLTFTFFLLVRNILVQDSTTVQNLPLFNLSPIAQSFKKSFLLKIPSYGFNHF